MIEHSSYLDANKTYTVQNTVIHENGLYYQIDGYWCIHSPQPGVGYENMKWRSVNKYLQDEIDAALKATLEEYEEAQ